MSNRKDARKRIKILDLIKCNYEVWPPEDEKDVLYWALKARPAKGVLHITEDTPYFIRGKIEVRGSKDGQYPLNYLDMIDHVFGSEPNTIEACSRTVQVDNIRTGFTVDINSKFHPSLVGDATKLNGVEDNIFNRWRSDPPYNARAAKMKYQTNLPKPMALLRAGARVCKVGSLMFFLWSSNYQFCPKGVIRVGLISLSVVPNNEDRALNIYYKYEHHDS